LGTWPIQLSGVPEEAATAEYIGRIQAYMGKALHEAKLNTSWIQPNEEWDAAMHDFVRRVLDSSPRSKFLPGFLPVVHEIPRLASRVGFPPVGERWKDTALEFPETLSLENSHNLFTCRDLHYDGRQTSMADIMPTLPFAVITNL